MHAVTPAPSSTLSFVEAILVGRTYSHRGRHVEGLPSAATYRAEEKAIRRAVRRNGRFVPRHEVELILDYVEDAFAMGARIRLRLAA
jgi:hypothetical protein